MKIHRFVPVLLVSFFFLSACAGQISAVATSLPTSIHIEATSLPTSFHVEATAITNPQPTAVEPTRAVLKAYGPEVIAQINLHGSPQGIAKGFNSLWVAAHRDNTVYRLDPSTGQIQASITDGINGPEMFAVLDDAVWVSNAGDGPANRSLARIDPNTNKVTATVNTPPGGMFYVAVYQDAPWMISPDSMSLSRVDPKTYQLNSIQLPVKSYWDEIYSDTQGIWVNDGSNLYLINPKDGSMLKTLPLGGDPDNSYVRAFSGSQFLVMDKQKFWLLDAKSGKVTDVSMDPSITSIPVDDGAGTYGEGAFWAIGWGKTSMLLEIDPKSHKAIKNISAGYSGSPTGSIFPDGATVWLTLFDMDSLVKVEP